MSLAVTVTAAPLVAFSVNVQQSIIELLNDSDYLNNASSPGCIAEPVEELGVVEKVFLALTLGIMIAIMIIGNILVILAILMERELQRAQYYLVLSLAAADLMVGVVVSPLSALYDINRQWHLGVPMCDFWILSDVLACTSSILHLVAIALDRYWSITDVAYMQKRTARRIGYMIAVVWAISFCVSVAPMLGWKDALFHCRVEVRNECLISQDPSYQIFSTTTAFYGPLVLICILYWKIYKAAKRRIRMQVKRRSNTTVAQIRAKIMALQQAELENQDGRSCVEPAEETVYEKNDDHSTILANGRLTLKEKAQRKKSNVQIRLIQPSSNEPTCSADPEITKSHHDVNANTTLNVSQLGSNSFCSLSDIDSSPEDTTAAAVTTSTMVQAKISDATADQAPDILNSAMSLKKCNGTTPTAEEMKSPRKSIDQDTEDEADYAEGWQAQSPLRVKPPRRVSDVQQSLTAAPAQAPVPAPVPVLTSHPASRPVSPANADPTTEPPKKVSRCSIVTTSSPGCPRPSLFSQSEYTSTTFTGVTNASVLGHKKGRKKKESVESSRERRAGRTLAIITGIFVASWLPFFILALIRPLCGDECAIPKPVESVFAWLGYVNSAVNPVIYTVFSPDFRNAFKKTLKRLCFVR